VCACKLRWHAPEPRDVKSYGPLRSPIDLLTPHTRAHSLPPTPAPSHPPSPYPRQVLQVVLLMWLRTAINYQCVGVVPALAHFANHMPCPPWLALCVRESVAVRRLTTYMHEGVQAERDILHHNAREAPCAASPPASCLSVAPPCNHAFLVLARHPLMNTSWAHHAPASHTTHAVGTHTRACVPRSLLSCPLPE
jgi:hypothetical protein